MILDDEETLNEYKEPLEFYTWDRQPIDSFMKLASMDKSNYSNVVDVVSKMVMDKDGGQIITKDNVLPNKVLMKVITKVVESLGK
jgi:hypothetical protein